MKQSIGEHVTYTPLPHFFGGGCDDSLTIRAAVETAAWATHVFGQSQCYLRNSFNTANDIMAEAGCDGTQAVFVTRYRLPTAGRTYTTWISGGLSCLPNKERPANEKAEQLLVTSLIAEIPVSLAVDLDPAPSFERRVGSKKMAGGGGVGRMLVIGSSNARQLHAALVNAKDYKYTKMFQEMSSLLSCKYSGILRGPHR
jgi:hypothetical protein